MARLEFVLDIDQTLAGGVVPAHMGDYNVLLGLGMTPDEIAATASIGKTFDVPQIQRFRNPLGPNGEPDEAATEVAEARFQEARAKIRTSETVHLAFNELPGSVEGVIALAMEAEGEGVEVNYYTVRPPEVEGATKQWLENKGFPHPERVVICDSPADKLQRILRDKILSKPEEERGTVVLIDDSFDELVSAAGELKDPTLKDALKHLVLVGFTITDDRVQMEGSFYPNTGLRTLALPSWDKEHLARLKQQLQ